MKERVGLATGVRLVALVAAIGFVLGPPAAAQVGPDFNWKWKKKVVADGGPGAIVVDSQAHPHVFFNGGGFVGHTWSDGKTWFSETVDDGVLPYSAVAAAIDGQDVMHVAYGGYSDPLGGTDDTDHLRYAHGVAGAWQAEEVAPGGIQPSIAVGDDGVVHIVHEWLPGYGSRNEVDHAELTPSGWETDVLGTWPPGYDKPRVLVHEGDIYATFSTSSIVDGLLVSTLHLATRSADTWTIEDIDTGRNGGLAFDGDGLLHVVYETELDVGVHELRHAWPVDGVWQHETLVTQNSLFGEDIAGFNLAGGSAVLAQDPAGRVQMVFSLSVTKGENGTVLLMAATWQDGAWWPRKLGPASAGWDPSIAISRSGIVHAACTKSPPSGSSHSMLALEMKGRKLRLVTKGLGGVITDTTTGAVVDDSLLERYYPGTEVTLTATQGLQFGFLGWSGAASGTDPQCTVTLDKNRKVVARFTFKKY